MPFPQCGLSSVHLLLVEDGGRPGKQETTDASTLGRLGL